MRIDWKNLVTAGLFLVLGFEIYRQRQAIKSLTEEVAAAKTQASAYPSNSYSSSTLPEFIADLNPDERAKHKNEIRQSIENIMTELFATVEIERGKQDRLSEIARKYADRVYRVQFEEKNANALELEHKLNMAMIDVDAEIKSVLNAQQFEAYRQFIAKYRR